MHFRGGRYSGYGRFIRQRIYQPGPRREGGMTPCFRGPERRRGLTGHGPLAHVAFLRFSVDDWAFAVAKLTELSQQGELGDMGPKR